MMDAYLNIQCGSSGSSTSSADFERSYWQLSQDEVGSNGLSMFVITDFFIPNIRGYSVTVFICR
jgi:hypothetical protein